MELSLIQTLKFVKGLAPAADRWNTNPSTDVVNMANYSKCTFLIHQQGGTTGTATITISAATDAAGSSPTAIPFKYSVGGTGASAGGDDAGAMTDATAAGFTTTANADKLYLCEVNAIDLPATKNFVFMTTTEAVNDPVNGAVEIILSGSRYAGASQPTAIS